MASAFVLSSSAAVCDAQRGRSTAAQAAARHQCRMPHQRFSPGYANVGSTRASVSFQHISVSGRPRAGAFGSGRPRQRMRCSCLLNATAELAGRQPIPRAAPALAPPKPPTSAPRRAGVDHRTPMAVLCTGHSLVRVPRGPKGPLPSLPAGRTAAFGAGPDVECHGTCSSPVAGNSCPSISTGRGVWRGATGGRREVVI